MHPERIKDIFDAACEVPEAQRDALIDRESGGDTAVASSVRALLRADTAASRSTLWQHTALELEASATAHSPDPSLGARLGAYRITGILGSGGMGTVYRARRDDEAYEQDVAIKRLRRGMDADRIVTRFRTERRILATLDHPNIARLVDGGSDEDGLPFFVMEYVSGVTPVEYAGAHGLSVRDRVRLFLPICDAVHYAHQRMVIHRDIKPGNILVTADGTPKLLDFGIAKLLSAEGSSDVTMEHGPILTPRYASPEQMRSEAVTSGSDVYSLGICLAELLAPAVLPVDLRNIIAKAVAAEASARYGSADQFAEDLRRYLDGRPVTARGDGFWYVSSKFVRRHMIPVGIGVVALITMAAAILVTTRAERRAARRFEEVRRLAHSVVFDYHDAIADLPGATAVRERLVRDALEYLDSLSREADDPDLRRELVDAYVRISNVQGNSSSANLGHTAAAVESIEKAIAQAERLVADAPTPQNLRSAGAAYASGGDMAMIAGALSEGERRYRRALDLQARAAASGAEAIALSVDRAETLRKLAAVLGGVGTQNLGRTSESLAIFAQAKTLAAGAAAAMPYDHAALHEDFIVSLDYAAGLVAVGRRTEGIAEYTHATDMAEKIVARWPSNQLYQSELANVALRTGVMLMDDARYQEALGPIQRSRDLMVAVVAADPSSNYSKRNLSVIENHYARALVGAERPADALAQNLDSLTIAETLSRNDPASMELAADVAISHRKTAATLTAMRRLPDAIQHASQSVDALRGIVRDAADAYVRAHLARALLVRGEAFQAAHATARALDDFREAQRIFAPLSANDPGNVVAGSDLARAELALGQALSAAGRPADARVAIEAAVQGWARMRLAGPLTAEDAVLASRTAAALAALPR